MKTEQIREMSDKDLQQALEDNRKELFNLRFQIETRKIKNHQRIPAVKRDIARMNTILRERELIRLYGAEDVELVEEPEPEEQPPEQVAPRRGRLLRRGSKQEQPTEQQVEEETGES
jgi:large subunit ribosomal protein L29